MTHPRWNNPLTRGSPPPCRTTLICAAKPSLTTVAQAPALRRMRAVPGLGRRYRGSGAGDLAGPGAGRTGDRAARHGPHQRGAGRAGGHAAPDASPRISPAEPYVAKGQLLVGAMAWSKKAADLRRDPRFVLHSAVTNRVPPDQPHLPLSHRETPAKAGNTRAVTGVRIRSSPVVSKAPGGRSLRTRSTRYARLS